MGQVIASASMSLDGYIAKDDNTIGMLFDWLNNGPVAFPTINPDMTFHMTAQSAEYMGHWVSEIGALICGRTLFDFTGGWDGLHTMNVPVVVLTHTVPSDWIDAHPGAPFHFVTEGIEAALEQARNAAGGKDVSLAGGAAAARQYLKAGLVDEMDINLAPVILGRGERLFEGVGDLGGLEHVRTIAAPKAVHYKFVRRA